VVVVVTPAPAPAVVVVVEAPGDVVEVALPVGSVVLVVVEVGPDVVLVVEATVVEVVDVVGVVAGAGVGLTRFFRVVPVSAPPKIADNGLPEMSSMAVMSSSASTNTVTAPTAMAFHENPGAADRRAAAGGIGLVEACKRSMPGASAAAEISRRCVSATAGVDAISTVSSTELSDGAGCARPTTSVGAEDASTDDVDGPLASVPPSLRSKLDVSGTRTATCLTASWPRSIDCATNAVPMVAAAEPMATPMMVPLTPKVDATMAAMTAPAVEARIWRNENFTPGVSSRPRRAGRRGR
jgi:hypothetical protein